MNLLESQKIGFKRITPLYAYIDYWITDQANKEISRNFVIQNCDFLIKDVLEQDEKEDYYLLCDIKTSPNKLFESFGTYFNYKNRLDGIARKLKALKTYGATYMDFSSMFRNNQNKFKIYEIVFSNVEFTHNLSYNIHNLEKKLLIRNINPKYVNILNVGMALDDNIRVAIENFIQKHGKEEWVINLNRFRENRMLTNSYIYSNSEDKITHFQHSSLHKFIIDILRIRNKSEENHNDIINIINMSIIAIAELDPDLSRLSLETFDYYNVLCTLPKNTK